MTRKKDSAKTDWKAAMGEDPDFMKGLVREVLQQVLEAEMEETLGAAKSQRTEGRIGYRSGYYSRSLVTRVGNLELRVPQDRAGQFSTQVFEQYQRSEKALVAAQAQMYLQRGARARWRRSRRSSAATSSVRRASARPRRGCIRSWISSAGGGWRKSFRMWCWTRAVNSTSKSGWSRQ